MSFILLTRFATRDKMHPLHPWQPYPLILKDGDGSIRKRSSVSDWGKLWLAAHTFLKKRLLL
ncbi:hypothetical protein [Adlercreutzia equolifaciens]|uniref:hypothetical protein n=1 Tax=Adlercreutzia equolifaciens TaxID=446660 RepID=UPI00266CAAAA|nr:hypothetical protein [Adlercreutzia equolifaciens]